MKRGEIILEEDDVEGTDIQPEFADKSNLTNKYATNPLFNQSGDKITEWKNKEYDDLWKKCLNNLKIY